MQEVREVMSQIEADATGIKATLERMERSRTQRQTTDVRIEAGGGAWTMATIAGLFGVAGLTIGVALGAAIACAAWVAGSLGDLTDDQRNDDAFIQATYQAVPGLREHFDKIRAEQAEEQP